MNKQTIDFWLSNGGDRPAYEDAVRVEIGVGIRVVGVFGLRYPRYGESIIPDPVTLPEMPASTARLLASALVAAADEFERSGRRENR